MYRKHILTVFIKRLEGRLETRKPRNPGMLAMVRRPNFQLCLSLWRISDEKAPNHVKKPPIMRPGHQLSKAEYDRR